MEKQVLLPTSNNKKILGKLRGSLQRPLVVFVHGLSSHLDHHIFFNGARYFEKRGFASFRFNFYGNGSQARRMIDCTLKVHIYDLNRVIEYFRKKRVKRIFLVGHSLGGLTILMSNNRGYDSLVLWDASYNPVENLFSSVRYIKEMKGYVYRHAYNVIVNRELVRETKNLQCDNLTRNIHVPIKIICAEKGILVPGGKVYYKNANKPKSFVVIKNATHSFGEDGNEERLFKETIKWFKNY